MMCRYGIFNAQMDGGTMIFFLCVGDVSMCDFVEYEYTITIISNIDYLYQILCFMVKKNVTKFEFNLDAIMYLSQTKISRGCKLLNRLRPEQNGGNFSNER